ncbi:hypothetical protein BDY21DRAFT_360691 [Lineolata rhizophorae]|uniref:Uncharacterized protein n=1 Tax=Lineolata rhizophorae TaxID=578093 RepID=A0A6A6PDV5_9PEZI|nr:hypothetical protein BDY21DRAFT_360691 [Lineolata rhizophorae]
MASESSSANETKKSIAHRLRTWGENPIPPTALATLVTAQHARPFQPVPMLFPPVLLFSTYLNLSGFQTDAAGISAAWSTLYVALAMRRKHRLAARLGVRGAVRGATLLLCVPNIVGGGLAYTFGRRERIEARERGEASG